MVLSTPELRVLGALIEKEISTPDAYPLSLNALQAACNQRSSRDPVADYSDEELRQALHGLEDRGLAGPARGGVGSPAGRVTKYEHYARSVLKLRRDETAVLCLLLLRGPQTPGDLRARADRLYPFDDLQAVAATLDRLSGREADEPGATAATGPLVAALPRTPGSRETRYTHLLGGAPAVAPGTPATAPGRREPGSGKATGEAGGATISALLARIERLESRVVALEGRPAAEGNSAPLPAAPAEL